MVHAGWFECGVIAVAGIALRRSRNMGTRFAERRAAVMTGRTGSDSIRGVYKRRTAPHRCRLVAGIALGRGDNVSSRLGLGVGKGIGTTVAGRAIACGKGATGICMVHGGRIEGREILVAGVAGRRRQNVIRRLAKGTGAVVTAGTTTGNHTHVAEDAGRPGCVVFGNTGRVAGIALRRRGDVRCRFRLGVLRHIGAAVTGRALTGQTSVVHGRRSPE